MPPCPVRARLILAELATLPRPLQATLLVALVVGVVASLLGRGQPPVGLDAELGAVAGFPAVWESYRNHKLLATDTSADTIARYRWACWDFADPQGGYLARLKRPKPWHKATADDARRWLQRPVQAGPRAGEPLAARTRNNYTAAVKDLYRYAYLGGILRRDPMALLHYARVGDDQPRSFTEDELVTILRAAQAAAAGADGDDRLELLFWLGYNTLRSHAMAALSVEDFWPTPSPGSVWAIRKGKPGLHEVPLNGATRAVLDRYLARRRLMRGDPLVDNRRFPGKHLTANAVQRLLFNLIRGDDFAGLERGSGHWLRNTGLTVAGTARKGRNVEALRELADHADSATTRRFYLRGLDYNVREEAVDLIRDPLAPRRA